MLRFRTLLLAALIAMVVFPATHGHAQQPGDGALSGQVSWPDGRPAAGANVRLLAFGTGDDEPGITTTANRNGFFGLLTLPAGNYRVEATYPSAPALRGFAVVHIEEETSTRVKIELSDQPAKAPATAASTASPHNTLSASELEELPINAGEWEDLSRVLPAGNDATPAANSPGEEQDGFRDGAEELRHGAEDGSTHAASGLSYAGLPVTQDRETVNGLNNEQSFRSGPRGSAAGGPASGSSYAQSALRSVRVLPRNFSAQYGNAAALASAVRTRGGGDRVHGTAFYLLRESAFAATNPYSTVTHYGDGAITTSLVKPEDHLHQFGGRVSLPLAAIFGRQAHPRSPLLFLSAEQQLRRNPVVSTPSDPLFYALSATQTALLRNRGVTAAKQNAALDYLDSLTGAVDRRSARTLAFLRVDEQATARDHLSAAYALTRFDAPAGTGFDQRSEAVTARGRGSAGNRTIQVDAVSGEWKRVLSTHLHNAVRFGWSRDSEAEQPVAPLAQEPAISPGGLAPQVSIAPDGFAYGTPAALGRSAYPDEQRVQAAEALLFARGRHLLSVGGNWSRIHDRIAQLSNAEGSFLYDSGVTGGRAGGLVDWITDYTFNVNAYPNGGCPSIVAPVHDFCFRSFTQSFGGEQTEFVTHEFAGFAEDHVRLHAGLSMSFGVRYEYILLPLPQEANTALDAAFADAGGALHGATSSFPEDRNNVGPRFSLAWAPAHGALGTVHIGYGVFFGRLTGATTRAALTETAMQTSTTRIRITPTTETACPQVANQGFGYPCAFVSAPPAAVLQTSSALLFASNFRLPAVQRGSLLWERRFGKYFSIHAEYAASVATQLPGSTDLNIAPSRATRTFVLQGGDGHTGLRSGQTFTVPLYIARRVTQYGPLTAVVSNANSTYHAGTMEAAVQGLRHFELRGSFTFSRAIDYSPQPGATPRLDGQFDPFTNGYDKALSSLSFPVRFSGELIYRSHVERGARLLRDALNGWHVASIAFAGSGAPYSYAIFGGTRLSGGRESINGSGGANYLPTVGRNTLRLPPRASVDLRIGREVHMGNHASISAFAEAFNLLNQRNLSRVETRAFLVGTAATPGAPTPLIFQDAAAVAAEGLSSQPFGTPTSSTTGLNRERQAEFGVRLNF